MNFAHHFRHNDLLLRGQVESLNKLYGGFDRLFAELMDVQLALMSIFDRDGENLRFQPRAAAYLARLTCHERANAMASEFTLCFLIKPLHLRHESFERLSAVLFFVIAETHFNRLAIRAEIKRLFKFVR